MNEPLSSNLVKQKNDDTKTKLGDIYHYYVVLSYCLDLQESETILVEKYGDISIVSEEDSKNLEVKRHQGEHVLNDRHIDFWKTLLNWVKYHHNMRDFKKLILYTTSNFKENSKLKSWNLVKAHERLKIISEIGHQKTKLKKAFVPFMKPFFIMMLK